MRAAGKWDRTVLAAKSRLAAAEVVVHLVQTRSAILAGCKHVTFVDDLSCGVGVSTQFLSEGVDGEKEGGQWNKKQANHPHTAVSCGLVRMASLECGVSKGITLSLWCGDLKCGKSSTGKVCIPREGRRWSTVCLEGSGPPPVKRRRIVHITHLITFTMTFFLCTSEHCKNSGLMYMLDVRC